MIRPVWKREQVETGQIRVRPLLDVAPMTARPEPAPLPERMTDEVVSRQLRLLNNLAAGLVTERSRHLTELRPVLLDLVMAVCRELLGREASTDPAVVEHVLRQALTVLAGATGVVARLEPEDATWLQKHWTESGLTPSGVELVADTSLKPGECVLESDRGGINATWETQLRLVREALSWETGEDAD